MSTIFWKNIYLCFSKLKCTVPRSPEPLPPPSPEDHHRPSPLHFTTQTLIKNFNSLYDLTTTSDSTSNSKSLTSSSAAADADEFFSTTTSDDSDTDDSPPDFATVFASQRFFFSSPGHSKSISDTPPPPPEQLLVTGGVAIHTNSPDPFSDFRNSMQEMIEARQLFDVKANWEYLHELLVCYLTLNPQHTHKFIIGAFADLVVSLLSSTAIDTRGKPKTRHECSV